MPVNKYVRSRTESTGENWNPGLLLLVGSGIPGRWLDWSTDERPVVFDISDTPPEANMNFRKISVGFIKYSEIEIISNCPEI